MTTHPPARAAEAARAVYDMALNGARSEDRRTAAALANQAAGAVTLNLGVFINTVISFIIIAFAIFMVIRNMNKLKKKEEEAPAPEPLPGKSPH